jgi:benzoyl-CoA 2,3-dioxygenase component B
MKGINTQIKIKKVREGYNMSSVEIVEQYEPNFQAWVEQFEEWQTRIGFDPAWLGDYRFNIQFDWESAGDTIEFGDFEGMPKWDRRMQIPQQSVRDAIISMLSVQGDTEFGSVEQQWHLLDSAPTEYDRKSALRIMCEEQRHGWQMAYILCNYFGEHGIREAQKLLERNSSSNPIRSESDRPRLLGSFNEPIRNWIDFFCFTHFIDRDGKYQLKMLSTSSFKPLAASMGPMLKEESFHLGTGANGLRRIVKQGVVPISLLQKYINKWVSTGLDLFGVDESTSAQWAYVYGIKGRFDERESDIPADRDHLNEASRNLYWEELRQEMVRINKGRPEGQEELFIPSDKFNRGVGNYVDIKFTTTGEPFTGDNAAWKQYLYDNLPNDEDLPELDELFKQDWIQYREWKANW